MKIIHTSGFEAHEVEYYRKQIFDNLCDTVRQTLYAMEEWEIPLDPANAVRRTKSDTQHV